MIKKIETIVFPDNAEITDVSVSLTDMGERTITLTVKIDGDETPDFSDDLKISFDGETYVHSARRPQATKDNNSRRATYSLTFQHEAIVELQRYYFIEMASTTAGTAIADKYDASMGLTLPDFITALVKVLNYYFGNKITANLNPSWSSSDIPSYVEINYSYIWDVLQKVYEIYAVRWTIEKNGGNYIIKFGYDAEDATHIFEYGYKGGLLKVERQVQSTNIKNILLGRGSDKNLPIRNYFKGTDPDACPELTNISFTELRSAEFRSYVQGWNAKNHGGTVSKSDAHVNWAWEEGYNDAKFNPIEYVKDDASIEEYGELWGALENNDAIYPSMEGLNDAIVAVDEITDDDVDVEKPDVTQKEVPSFEIPLGTIKKGKSSLFSGTSSFFTVPSDKMGAMIFGVMSLTGNSKEVKLSLGGGGIQLKITLNEDNAALLDCVFNVQIRSSHDIINPASIPPGLYYIAVDGTVNNTSDLDIENVKIKFESSSLVIGDGTNTSNPNVFHIWIGNIWGSQKNEGESDEEYTNRVWQPILGTESEEAAVVFRTGLLSISDYNFLIVKDGNESAVAHDETKEGSHWRITLQKSDAEYAATGKLLPNSQINAKAGDRFYFTGIELPHKYVVAAENRLYEYKLSRLNIVKDIQPTWVVTIDKIRANKLEEIDEVKTLAEQLKVGAKIRLRDKRFMPAGKAAEYIEQYIQSVTYSWKEPSNNSLYLYPDIEVVLSDEVTGAQNPVETLSGKIDALERQIGYGGNGTGVTSNIQQILRALFNRIYLRKDMSDTTPYKLTSSTGFEVGNFVQGSSGAIVYRDAETGQTIGELDKLYVRMKAYFETLEIVNVNSIGGKQIISPAGAVRLALVVGPGEKYTVNSTTEEGVPEETEVIVPEDTYRCFFLAEQDGQEVENRYKVDDQVQSKDFNIKKPGKYNQVTNHYYWRLVTGVTVDPIIVDGVGYHYVDLSATDADTSSDAPAVGDVIAQLGNRKDVDRQNALVFSSVDTFSPSITLYQGINSYSYLNKEMVSYGVDKTKNQAFMNVYGNMFVGKRDNSTYIKYTQENGVEIKGKLAVGSTLGNGKTIEETLKEVEQSAINSANENIQSFKDAVTKDVENLQNQIDGAIETWFDEPKPTLENYPANEWVSTEDKNMHLGDLYYSGEGKAYRFQMEGDDYVWKEIVDTDITKALADAKKAQDTADGKRKVFVKTPTDADEYDVGDLWVNATYGDYTNEVLRAVTKKAAGTEFNISHWTKASKYTDDTKAEEVQKNVDTLSTTVNNLSGTVNDMKSFTDTAFADGIVDRSEKSAIENYLNNIKTTKADVENSYSKVYDNALLDGVPKTNLASAYTAFNSAVKELESSINSAIQDGVATSTERATVDAKYTNFNTKYGDFIAALNAANKYIQDKINATAQDALTQIGGLAYLKKALKEDTTVSGGLIQSSVIALGYTATDGVYKVMSGTNGIYEASKRGGGIASWWGGAMKDRADYEADAIPADAATGLIRMDGTGYFANGALWWDIDGNLHADPQSFIIKENQLGDYLELFQIIYRKSTKTIDYMIPQYVMQHVEAADYLQIGDGRLKWDATNKAIYVEGKDGSVIGLYSKGWVSALGASPSTGGSGGGGGLIQSVYRYNDLGKTTFSDSNLNDTFNAYTINEINKRLTAVEKGGGITPNDVVTLSTAQTITGQKTWTVSQRMANTSIQRVNKASGSNATGSHWYTADYVELQFGIGVYTDSNANPRAYIGWGTAPWTVSDNLTVSSTQLTYKANNILHAANYNGYAPSKTGTGASGTWGISISGGAAKLTTARTLWGQSFNGTANVSGNMTGVGSITMSGALSGATTGAFSSTLSVGGAATLSSTLSVTGTSTFTGETTHYGNIRMGRWNLYYLNNASGGSATGLYWRRTDDYRETQFGIGCFTEDNASPRGYIGWSSEPWDVANSLMVSETSFTYKGNSILHAANYNGYAPSKTGTGASGTWGISISGGAAKLTTARTLWGQSFNGTANVSGNLTSVGHIQFLANATYSIGTDTNNVLTVHAGTIKSRGTLYVESGTSSSIYLRPGSVSTSSGLGLVVNTSGDVSISGNITNATYTLNNSSTNPYLKLVHGGINWYLQAYRNTYMCLGAGTTNSLRIDNQGNTYTPGTFNAKVGIWSDGYVSALGQNQSSDMRLKNKLRDITIPVAAIANAPAFLFSWKNKDTKDVGSSAQYWLNVLPDAVKQRGGYYEMGYGNIALVSCISLAKFAMRHETEIEKLKRENRNMKKRIKELERRVLS